ncbi:MAG: autotransporter-associated beta strand repeat-containing protein [Tepidisphaeraceae bacterium]
MTFFGDGGVTVGGSSRLVLGSANNPTGTYTYNLNGGTLTVPRIAREATAGSATATFNFNGGTLRPTAASTTFLQGLTAANVKASGAIVDTNGLAVTIAQPLLHDASLAATADGGVTKLGAGTLTLSGTNTYTGTTTIAAGTLRLVSDAQSPVFASGGADLLGGLLVFDYTGGASPAALVQSTLAAGFGLSPQFSAGAIRSSALPFGRTIGFVDDGVSQLTIALTRPGDLNLDFTVNFSDLLSLAAHYGQTGGSVTWSTGDVNYDGTVNFADLLALAANYGLTSTSFESDWAMARAAVPEPATLLFLAPALLVRRRRS